MNDKPYIKVICRKNESSSAIFTDGKVYEARHIRNALYGVRDDIGYERFIIPDVPCPHLKLSERSTGVFETVEEQS